MMHATANEPGGGNPSWPAPPAVARRHYPVLMRLARTYRVAAWLGLVVGPLIGLMALSSSFEAVGRLLWILLVVAATALMFVTWRATSELIVTMLEMAEGLHRAESQIAGLHIRLAEPSAAGRETDKRKAAKRGRLSKRQTSRKSAKAGSRASNPDSSVTERAERVSPRGNIDRAV